MTETESRSPDSLRRRIRLRRFFLRHVPLGTAGLIVLLVLVIAGIYFAMSSARFENFVRARLVSQLEQSTGGRVEIAGFHWRLLRLEAEADGLVIHGLESPNEAPLLHVDRLIARLSILDLWSHSVRLRDLEIIRPTLHLIVYRDGSTNQPHPPAAAQNGNSLDAIFNMKAGHVRVEQGTFDCESRATSFDFQNRYAPLSFEANNVSVLLRYMAAAASNPEAYRIQAGASDLNLSRSVAEPAAKPVHGNVQMTLDFMRNAAALRSLRLTALGRDGSAHALDISGTLQNFSHPGWQAKLLGDLDMRLLDSLTGYPFAPEGIAHLDLNAAGALGEFRADGPIHIDGGAYIGTGVVATGVRLDAQIHADQSRLLISNVVARLRQGGQIEGTVDLSPWLPGYPGTAELRTAVTSGTSLAGTLTANHRSAASARTTPAIPKGIEIPVIGKVTAQFKDVSLDTLLDMVSQPPYQRLGVDALLNGLAVANWSNGDSNTVAVTANLSMNPSAHPLPGEVPGTGVVDGTYTQRNGGVDLRELELRLPASQITAHGLVGAYPMTSPSELAVELHSKNLGEFDTVLRGMGLKRNGRYGAAALPVALNGQADFHGSWAGSLTNPLIAGTLNATGLAVEMPAGGATVSTRMVHLDSVDAAGSYSSTRIAIDRGVLVRGTTRIALSGSLTATAAEEPVAAESRIAARRPRVATSAKAGIPAYDQNSVLHLHMDAANVGVDDVQPFIQEQLPIAGTLTAQVQADGPIRTLGGTGWVQLDKGSLFGEPVSRVRAQGKIAGKLIGVASASIVNAAGSVSGSGSYDLGSKHFQFEARGASVDISKIDSLRRRNLDTAGKVSFNLRGSGTEDDPQLDGTATLGNLTLGGEPVGALQASAHTVNHALVYDLTTHLDSAEFAMHGQTALRGEYDTQATLRFSKFNIDSVLKLAHVKQISGDSSLAGTIALTGPLAHPEQFRGEARIEELEAAIAGVHLKSEGQLHATLANERIQLDPLHVTGEDTDLRASGTLSLNGARQMDLATSGSINLKLAETIDPDLTASGTSTFQVEAHGPLNNPRLNGRVDFQNGALSLEDLPNGLSQLHGTLVFNQDRLEVSSLTAMSGGGPLTVGGYLSYQHGLYADLSVTGKGVRIRYPQGVSSLADSTLHLQGQQNNLLLSGDVLITRFTVSPDMDFAALAAETNAAQSITTPDAATNHIRLDVHIRSSPQLNFQNAFAKLAGDVDLHLRGTAATPSLQGRVSITEGSAMIAGTRYDLQRGDITFTNPVRIEPIIDLSASAHVEDYDITLDLHGTPDKFTADYRSDPPMPEADVVALLALGRTGNQQRLYTQQQEQALSNPTTDALLGGALNATVSSRVQKLFGAGSVKVDPNYLGPFGNSTSRIIVEEQVGRNVTLTYATDVNTTGQQLLQAEIAINHHVSLLVARDESGVFSMVIKATRRFK